MKKNSKNHIVLPITIGLSNNPSAQRLTSQQKIEQMGLVSYIEKLGQADLECKIFFSDEKSSYADFPLGDAKIVDVVMVLKNFLDFLKGKNTSNIDKAKVLVSKMHNEGMQVVNIFFYFLSGFFSKIGIEKGVPIDQTLISEIKQAGYFFYEKDIAKAIGFLIDVLSWDEETKLFDEGYFISANHLKKSLLKIINDNKQNPNDNQGINIFLCQHLLYEVTIREDKEKREKLLLKVISFIDHCDSQSLSKDYRKKSMRVNNGQILKWNIFLELMNLAFEKKENKWILYSFKELNDSIFKQFSIENPEVLSFDICHYNYNSIIKKIEKNLQGIDLEKNQDLKYLTSSRILVDAYSKLLKTMNSSSQFLLNIAKNREFLSIDLTDFQQKHFDQMIHQMSINPSSNHKVLDSLIAKHESLSGSDGFDLVALSQTADNTENKIKVLFSKVQKLYKEIEVKYFSSVNSYVNDFVSNKIDPKELILDNNKTPSKITFNVRKNQVKKMFKKHFPIISCVNGLVQIDFEYNGINLETIDDILNQLIIAFLAKQKRDKLSSETQSIYEANKILIEPFSFFSLSATEDNINEQKFHEDEDVFGIKTSISDEPLLFSSTVKLYSPKNERKMELSEEELSEPKIRPKRIKQKVSSDSSKNHISIAAKNEINSNKLQMQQNEEKQRRALREAQQFFVVEKQSEEKPKYTHILNIVKSDKKRKNPLIIALNKELKIDESNGKASKEVQQKVREFIKDVALVSRSGKDGIKFCDGVYVLKIRNLDGSSYRGIAEVRYLPSKAIVLEVNTLTKKVHADKAIRSAINSKNRRSRK